jgi:hypothetical protein
MAVAWLTLLPAAAGEHPMNRIAFWQAHYDEWHPHDDPRAARTHAIFQRVLRAAGARPGVVPRLFITKTDPWNISLPMAIPDGWVILSKGAIEICYRDGARGDDRLAFVLAHELAHHLKDDFWHVKFFQLDCALLLQGEAYEAVATLQRALKERPDAPDILNNLGVAFVLPENPRKAKAHLVKARELAPTDEAPLFNLGMLAHTEARQVGSPITSPWPPDLHLENPLLRSGLALAGANAPQHGTEDGLLTAFEVAGLDLWGTELVVLSACDTGLAQVHNGEGVYGLRRALVMAGSASQLMSLWKVADDATRDLMVAYYRCVMAGEGRAEALCGRCNSRCWPIPSRGIRSSGRPLFSPGPGHP